MPTPPPSARSRSGTSARGIAPSSLVGPHKAAPAPFAPETRASGPVQLAMLRLDLIFGLL